MDRQLIIEITQGNQLKFEGAILESELSELEKVRLKQVVHEASRVSVLESKLDGLTNHLKKNWKKYAVGAVVAGGALAGGKKLYDDKKELDKLGKRSGKEIIADYDKQIADLTAKVTKAQKDGKEDEVKKLQSKIREISKYRSQVSVASKPLHESVNEFLTEINESKIIDHVKKNWKKYAVGAVVAGGAVAGANHAYHNQGKDAKEVIADYEKQIDELTKKLAKASDEEKKKIEKKLNELGEYMSQVKKSM